MANVLHDVQREIPPAEGRLGVLFPGVGAVATTVIAGVDALRSGRTKPFGSMTQMGRLSAAIDPRRRMIRDLVPLAQLDDLVFGGWDIYRGTAYQAAADAKVLTDRDLEAGREALESVEVMPAVFNSNYVAALNGPNVKSGRHHKDLAEQLQRDIEGFRAKQRCSRVVMVWTASTERHHAPAKVHADLDRFEAGMAANDPAISPSMIYAYAAIKSRVPYVNGAPNLALEIPALRELANELKVPVAGKDFKTGQTLLKTVIAPALKARLLGLEGWFSTNILGNRDGEVLADPAAHRTKEESKLSVIDSILEPELYPELYGNYHHAVRINYYPPRGDNKESWDNVDIFGWLGYSMQLKIDFLCRDSILAAPVVLDLALLSDLAGRAGWRGIQDWLGFYFKAPHSENGGAPEHDLFAQLARLEQAVLALHRGERTLAAAVSA
jgi:myo-inositol-1-phosphate synthase